MPRDAVEPATTRPDDERVDGEALREENLRLRDELLVARDALVGAEAKLAEAQGRLRMLENELLRHQVFERMMSSRTGRWLQTYHRLRARLRG